MINSKIQPGSLEKMRRDLEASLKALDTDYIDCLMIHGADEPEHVSGDEIKEFLSKAKEQGKARACGFSSHGDMVKLLEIAAAERFHEVIMVPVQFHGPLYAHAGGSKKEWDAQALAKAIDKCGAAGIDFVAMKGCSGGFLKDSTGPQTYRAALKWILENPYLKTTATAMGNFQEIDEDIRAMGGGKLGASGKGAPRPLCRSLRRLVLQDVRLLRRPVPERGQGGRGEQAAHVCRQLRGRYGP